MRFKTTAAQKFWERQFITANEHSLGVLHYAGRLADLVEQEVERQGGPVECHFVEASMKADAPASKEITVVMYSFAIKLLCDVWIYGPELKVWNNLRWLSTGLPFRKMDGLVMPCFVGRVGAEEYGCIVGLYSDVARMAEKDLRTLVNRVVFALKFPSMGPVGSA